MSKALYQARMRREAAIIAWRDNGYTESAFAAMQRAYLVECAIYAQRANADGRYYDAVSCDILLRGECPNFGTSFEP